MSALHRGRRILFIQYTNPAGYPPLRHASHILANRGWAVFFFGTQALGTDGLVFDPHPRIVVRLTAHVMPGWRQKLHYVGFTIRAMFTALLYRPQWIYASDALGCLPAVWAGKICGARLAYHEHDSPGTDSRSPFWSVVKRARRRMARRAEICVLPNAHRIGWFKNDVETDHSRVICAWNCPAKEEGAASVPADDDSRFWMYYQGSVNDERLPLTVIESLALLPERVGLRVVGYETLGSRGYVQRLAAKASTLGISHARLDLPGLKHRRKEMLNAARASHLGLALMPRCSEDINLKHMVGASNKAFEYLACGIPVLVSDLPDWQATFVAPGYGAACDPGDARSIAQRVSWLLENPDKRRQMGERGRARILADWNYENQFAPVLAALERQE